MADRSTLTRPPADAALGGLAALLERLPHARPTLAVLTYHRVGPASERPDLHPGLCVAPEAFAAQVQLVVDRATPVGIDDVLAAASGGPALPPRAVHLTFDDAYAGIEEHAWPVLRAAGVPATMFVPTWFPDHDRAFWWDRLSHAVRSAPGPELRVGAGTWPIGSPMERDAAFAALRARASELPHHAAMAHVDEVVAAARAQGVEPCGPATSGWAGLRSMAAEGLALGAHSRRHPFLDRVGPDELDDEIAGSLADLRDRTGSAARPVFAYPSGAYDATVVAATARAGVEVAFTTDRGVTDLRSPEWLRVPRINVGRRATTALVRIQLNPGPHVARALARSVLHGTRPGRRPTSWRTSWS